MSKDRLIVRFITGFAIIAISALTVTAGTFWSNGIVDSVQELFGLTPPSSFGRRLDTSRPEVATNGPIIFQRGSTAAFDPPYNRGGQLYRVDPINLSENLFGEGSQPNISTDGTKLIFLKNTQLTRSDTTGYAPIGLATNGTPLSGLYPKYSPSGNAIAYNYSFLATSGSRYYHTKIISGTCTTCDITPISHDFNPTGPSSYLYPSWNPVPTAPVTSQVVFVRTSAVVADVDLGNFTGDIFTETFTVNADGTITEGQRQAVTNSPAHYAFPVYSHDGTKIAFVKFNADGSSSLNVMNANGTNATVLVTLPNGSLAVHHPSWSPDDTSIAYSDTNRINRVAVATNQVNVVSSAATADYDLWPTWAPGARTIRAVAASGLTGQQVTVPIELDAQGNESVVSFSVNFDQTKLSNPVVTLGSGSPAGTFLGTNLSQTASGKIGILLDRNGAVFAAGTRQIVNLRFDIASGATIGATPISFGATPTAQSVSDLSGGFLPTAYTGGTVTISPGATPTPFPATLSFEGRLRDRVGKSDSGIPVDGETDGTFTLTLPPATSTKFLQSVVLTGPNGNVWDTIPQTSNVRWVVGIADSLDGSLFNGSNGAIPPNSFQVGNAGTFKLFVPDSAPTSFTFGKSFTVTVTFSDNSTAVGSTSINRTQADVSVKFQPRPATSAPFGSTATFSALVLNSGPEVAHGVVFDGFIDSGFSNLTVTAGSGCSVTGTHVSCSVGDIDPGPSDATTGTSVRRVTFTAKAVQSGPAPIRIYESIDVNNTIDAIGSNSSDTATVTVGPPPSVELTGLEVTQAVQNLTNSTPLVADRHTFVRAHVRALSTASNGVLATASLTARNAATGAILGVVSNGNAGGTIRVLQTVGANGPKRMNLDDSFYFELPSDWTKAGPVQFTFAGNEFPFTCNEADAVKDCKVTVTFQKRRPFSMRLFSTSGKDPSGNYVYPSLDDQWQTIVEIASNFPVSGYGGDGVTLVPDTWTIDQAYCTDAGITALKDSLVAKRARDCAAGPCEDFYFALVPESVTNGICGIGFSASGKAAINFGDPTKPGYPLYPAIGVKTDNSGNAAVGLAELFNSRAHELGHNFGFAHTCYKRKADGTFAEGFGCVSVTSGDGTVSLTDGTISLKKDDTDPDTYYGFDPFRETLTGVLGPAMCMPPYLSPPQPGCDNNYLNHGRIYGPNTPDMMSYGPAAWISAYSYKRIFDSLAPAARPTTERSNVDRTDVPAGKVFQINGTITISTGAAQIGSVYTDDFNGTLSLPPVGDWVFSIRDSQSSELGRYGIQINSDPDGGDRAGFSLLAPWNAAARTIVLLHNGQVVATRQASANPPVVSVTFPNGGETLSGPSATFSWTAGDVDADALVYEVDYSTDNGATWKTLAINWTTKTYPVDLTGLAGSNQALIRVVASDGFNSSQAQSTATFTVPPRGPRALISSPENNHVFVGDQVITLNGMGLDIEDGPLSGSRLTWSSNLNGVLGTGSSLAISASTLQEGNHTVTLTATDSTGRLATAVKTFVIFRSRPVFPAAVAVGPTGLTYSSSIGPAVLGPQSLAIRNSGDGELTWSATTDQPWILLDTTTGSAPSNLDVRINPAGLAVGNYTGNITITSQGAVNSPQVVSVGLQVTAPSLFSITGRVVTPTGLGLRNARVLLTDSLGVSRSATTSSFGIFSFTSVPSGENYTISIASKRYRFAARAVQLTGNVTLPDFVGLE